MTIISDDFYETRIKFGRDILKASPPALGIFCHLLNLRNKTVTKYTIFPSIEWYLKKTTAEDYKNLTFIRILFDARDLDGAIDEAIGDLVFDLGGEQ